MSETPPRVRPPSSAHVLEVDGLHKSFGERAALRQVSLDVNRGELLAVLGPNGAGKTTLLSILAGITKPDSGRIERSDGEVGWVPQQAGLYRRLTVEENLRLFARMEEAEDVEGIIERMLDQTGLEDRRHDQVSSLSGGNQQRINIAIGLLGDPSVLLLDEPSSGLDPSQRVRLWEFVAGLAKGGTTVIYSTHQIEEVSHYGDRLVVLADGETIFDGTFAQMRRAAGPRPKGSVADPENDFVRFLRRRGH
ncbi:MAG: type transport system ATP-binding protein [Solirubrobacterales bacterium]|jgi:ABC-2 type transport system ATP-binding protein|nr:type transport system ATP-binding protein [Solirubrobacterales bacterium]